MKTKVATKSKKSPKTKARARKSGLKLVNFKASQAECATMKKNAAKYTNGNVGALIRKLAANPALLRTNRIRISKAA